MRPTTSCTRCSRSSSGRGIRWAVRFSARPRRSVRSTSDGLRDYFDADLSRAEPRRRRGRHLEHASAARRWWSGPSRDLPPAATAAAIDAAGGHAGLVVRQKDIEQSHICIGTPAYPQAHADRHAIYVLNTILGGSMSSRLFQHIREERGLAYAVFSNLTTYSDAGDVDDLRRLRDGQGRRGDRSHAGRAARCCATTPVPADEIAAREGSSEGQPDAEPREHLEPHVATGAAGAVLRPSLHARRDAREHRGRLGRRRPARRARTCSATAGSWPRSSGRSATQPADGRPAEDLDAHDSALHAYGHGRHLERRPPVRDMARGRARRHRRAGRMPASCPRPTPATLRERAAFDIARIDEIEQTTQHDVIAFTTAVAETRRPGGALAALRPDLVGRARHGARAADARRRAI